MRLPLSGARMTNILFLSMFIFSLMSGASTNRYLIGKSKTSRNTLSELQLKIRMSHKADEKGEWESDGEFSICYSPTPKEDCYKSVGNVLTEIGLPKDKNDPVIYTRYAYGLDFESPDDSEKVKVKSEQVIEWQPEGADHWKPITPALLATSTQVMLGHWVGVEFREAKDRFTKLEVRMQRSELALILNH